MVVIYDCEVANRKMLEGAICKGTGYDKDSQSYYWLFDEETNLEEIQLVW